MTRTAPAPNSTAAVATGHDGIDVVAAAALDFDVVLHLLGTGPTACPSTRHRRGWRAWAQIRCRSIASPGLDYRGAQLRSPLLFLLFATAALSAVLGEHTNAIIIIVILFASAGLGGRKRLPSGSHRQGTPGGRPRSGHHSERRQHRRARCGRPRSWRRRAPRHRDRSSPADIRLVHVDGLSCEESVLTGEALPGREVDGTHRSRRRVGRAALLRADGHGGARRPRLGSGRRDRHANRVRAHRTRSAKR